MRRRNPFDVGSLGGLRLSGGLGGVNVGPTTSHLQLALAERMVAKIAASGLEKPAKVEVNKASAKRNTAGARNDGST